MKRILILVLAIICGVSFSDNFAKKPKKKVAAQDEQAVLDSLHKAEIRRLELEMQQEEEKHGAALEEMKKAVMNAAMEKEEDEELKNLLIPCTEEAQSDEEYYGALGISREEINSSSAIMSAIIQAQIELAKLVGEDLETDMIEMRCRQVAVTHKGTAVAYVALRYPKNKKENTIIPCAEAAQNNEEYYCALGVSEEEPDTKTALEKATIHAQMELAKLVGADLDQKKIDLVCRQVVQNDTGTVVAYVALRYPKNK
ncbi:MAG: hypothetical protein II970_00230 [Paludibacteraceae bacterium]|nr:hypothetical protein [Paludibacteraceae bacterium]